MEMPPSDARPRRPRPAIYGMIWRWHFYAALFCVPFVLWLALTGSVYLWRAQIEGWLDRPYDHLAVQDPPAVPERQVAAALAAVPGSTLHRYILPEAADRAVRVLVAAPDGEDRRVYVDPATLAVLKVAREEGRPMRLLFHLHGELLAGTPGSTIVEAAACWAVVMLLTGLYLWWPRGARGLAGVLYPRLCAGRRVLWRDLHGVAGLWVSLFALVLILTGLPWAKGWGSYLAEIRSLTGSGRGAVDWTIGGQPPKQDPLIGDTHAEHGHGGMRMAGMAKSVVPTAPGELARVVDAVRPLAIAPPVMITPPRRAGAPWRVTSDAADRPLRSDAEVNGRSGMVLGRTSFAQRHWIDRLVGTGVALHEGVLFGLLNQLAGTATALLLVVLAVSGTVLWWRRRPAGVLGAPTAAGHRRLGVGLVASILLLAIAMPAFGITLAAILCAEAAVLRRLPTTRTWLGLA